MMHNKEIARVSQPLAILLGGVYKLIDTDCGRIGQFIEPSYIMDGSLLEVEATTIPLHNACDLLTLGNSTSVAHAH